MAFLAPYELLVYYRLFWTLGGRLTVLWFGRTAVRTGQDERAFVNLVLRVWRVVWRVAALYGFKRVLVRRRSRLNACWHCALPRTTTVRYRACRRRPAPSPRRSSTATDGWCADVLQVTVRGLRRARFHAPSVSCRAVSNVAACWVSKRTCTCSRFCSLGSLQTTFLLPLRGTYLVAPDFPFPRRYGRTTRSRMPFTFTYRDASLPCSARRHAALPLTLPAAKRRACLPRALRRRRLCLAVWLYTI